MAYNKTEWIDRKTTVNATRLNNMEEGISTAHSDIEVLQGEVRVINSNEKITSNMLEQLNNERGYVNTKILHDQTDLNTLTENGKYRVFHGTNSPVEGQYMFIIDVIGESEEVSQVASFVLEEESYLFHRGYKDGKWSSWARLATNTDVETINSSLTNIEENIEEIENDINLLDVKLQTEKERVDTLVQNKEQVKTRLDETDQRVQTVENSFTQIQSQIGNTSHLLTTSKEVVGAINEIYRTGGSGISGYTTAKVKGSEKVIRIIADTTTNVFDTEMELDSSSIEVYLMGLRIFEGKDFTVNQNVITLESTLLPNEYIDILLMDSIVVDLGNNTVQEIHKRFEAQQETSSFTIEENLKYSTLEIYQMGVKLYEGYDYTLDRGTNQVTLSQALEVGDYVDYSIKVNTGTDITQIKDFLDYVMSKQEDIDSISSLKEKISKVDSSVKGVEASSNYNTIKIIKNDGTIEYVEIKTMNSDGNGINLFESGRVEKSYTATREGETSFNISPVLSSNSYVEVFFKNLRLINGTDYTITVDEASKSSSIELNFALKQGEVVYYTIIHASYDYNDLNNIPDLSTKANQSELMSVSNNLQTLSTVRGYLHCTSLNNGADLNTIIDNGVYGFNTRSNYKNFPSSFGAVVGNLIVYKEPNGGVSQLVIGSYTGEIMLKRQRSSTGEWLQWKKILTTDDMEVVTKSQPTAIVQERDWDSITDVGVYVCHNASGENSPSKRFKDVYLYGQVNVTKVGQSYKQEYTPSMGTCSIARSGWLQSDTVVWGDWCVKGSLQTGYTLVNGWTATTGYMYINNREAHLHMELTNESAVDGQMILTFNKINSLIQSVQYNLFQKGDLTMATGNVTLNESGIVWYGGATKVNRLPLDFTFPIK